MQTLFLYFPGIIVAFREGLEACLIIVILLRFLERTQNAPLKKNIWLGLGLGIIISAVVGGIFFWLGNFLHTIGGIGKMWESLMSLVAVGLIISFVIWMIHNGSHVKKHIETEAMTHLSRWGIVLMSTVCVAREGVEVAVFAYAGEYPWQGILLGIVTALGVSILLYIFSFRANLKMLFTITLLYLVLQCGYLLGYSIHEGLSALKELKVLNGDNRVFIKMFDLSQTIFNTKNGIVGLPLNIIFGWYAKPEWMQFIAQYVCTGILLYIWEKTKNSKS